MLEKQITSSGIHRRKNVVLKLSRVSAVLPIQVLRGKAGRCKPPNCVVVCQIDGSVCIAAGDPAGAVDTHGRCAQIVDQLTQRPIVVDGLGMGVLAGRKNQGEERSDSWESAGGVALISLYDYYVESGP